jgi:hypothetical protein
MGVLVITRCRIASTSKREILLGKESRSTLATTISCPSLSRERFAGGSKAAEESHADL